MQGKRTGILAAITLFVAVAMMSASEEPAAVRALKSYYAANLDTLHARVLRMQEGVLRGEDEAVVRARFVACRQVYKKLEPFIEYYYPGAALRLNGPALPEAEPAEPKEPQLPSGFQVIEETVYEDFTDESRRETVREISTLLLPIERLQRSTADLAFTEDALADALRLNLYRLIAKGLAGFDAPVSGAGIAEAGHTLRGMGDVMEMLGGDDGVRHALRNSTDYLDTADTDFSAFNRAHFIRTCLRPLQESLHAWRIRTSKKVPDDRAAIRPDAPHLFARDAYDPLFFAPVGTPEASPEKVALGKALFADPQLSATGTRACISCHQPGRAFTDGKRLNETLAGGRTLLRNTPTLYNAALSPVQFWDSRITFLEDQVHAVVSNPDEMGGDFARIVQHLSKDKKYRTLFRAAYPRRGSPTPRGVKESLAAYVRSLTALDSRFDRYMQGDAAAMTGEEIQGFNLFMGKAKCGTCHFAPFFNGAVPPLFEKMESEVLGIPSNSDTLKPVLDADSGKYALWGMEHHLRSFKTSSLRNVALTAPYMHNGVFATLDEVMDFYEKGGGAGLGFDLPNQTLPPDRLGLSKEEKAAVISFLKALTDETVMRRY